MYESKGLFILDLLFYSILSLTFDAIDIYKFIDKTSKRQ